MYLPDYGIELTYEPVNGLLIETVGDHTVIGYITYDHSPCNPMKEYDGQGELLTDESDVLYHLGLEEISSRWGEYVPNYCVGGLAEEAALIIAERIKNDALLIPWGVKLRFKLGRYAMEALAYYVLDGDDQGIDWDQEDRDNIDHLDPDEIKYQAWHRLREKGAVGTPLAVPVRYEDYGSYGIRVYTCDLDEANAVWVPDKIALENMNLKTTMSHMEKLNAARMYADGVLEEYEKYCNGETYGIVVEVFNKNGAPVDQDSVWDFIGDEHAEAAMTELYVEVMDRLTASFRKAA